MNRPSYWEGRYHVDEDDWELGGPAPPLAALLEEDPPAPRGGKVAVVGCGRGHDARLFARCGYETWGFDFAPYPIEEARALAREDGVEVRFEQKDIFALPEEYPGFFDLVWEYTSYCAIDPARRDEYLEAIREILGPGGALIGLFFPIGDKPGGPPFRTTEEDLRERLARKFRIASFETPGNSVGPRLGRERLVRAAPL